MLSPLTVNMSHSFKIIEDNQSILEMDKQIRILKASMMLMELKFRKESKARAFQAMQRASIRLDPEGLEQLSSEEVEDVRSITKIIADYVDLSNLDVHEFFARNLADKIEVEKQKQDESLNLLRSTFFQLKDSCQ